jgi:7-cyano-7-deazaguanine synthase in queuosine biosynthesis
MQRTPVELLWTGGWDSTFRLLCLLLEHRVPVQPSYLFDERRVSAPIEVATMDRLRARLTASHPHARALFLPTRIERVPPTTPDDDIQRAFDDILRTYRIGDQYAFLARFCRTHGLRDVELSIEWFNRGTNVALGPHVVRVPSTLGGETFRIGNDAPAPYRTLFGMFTFPLFETSKPRMAEVARRRGWNVLLEDTWFCHHPTKHLRPCGFCNPCQYALEQGFGARIPPSRRVLSVLYHHTLMPLRGRARQWMRRLRRHPAT